MDHITRRRRLVVKPSLTSAGTRVRLFALSASACLIGAAMAGYVVAQASPAPTPIVMAAQAGVPSACTGVSGSSLASALGYKSLPAPTSSTQHEQFGPISGTSTVCIYGAMTSAATVKSDVIVVYETFTRSVSNKQAVALFKNGLSQEANPGTKVRYSFGTVDGLHAITGKGTFKEGTVPATTEFMAAWHRTKACSVVLEKVVPKSNLQAALKLTINNFGM
jgi:hypothetical protein